MTDEESLLAVKIALTERSVPSNIVTVSLVQRRLAIGYDKALQIVRKLEEDGFINAPDDEGRRHLSNSNDHRMKISFEVEALTKFVGCDSDVLQAGTPLQPSLWILGIEHGTFNSRHERDHITSVDDTYSIETQMRFPFNKKLFALLTVLAGEPIECWRSYAQREKPFVKGVSGFFKGNLYPMACKNVKQWTLENIRETGFVEKNDYVDWCANKRLPAIRNWILEHGPRLVIALGVGHREHFARAVFGDAAPLHKVEFFGNKNLHHFERGGLRLVVLPHFASASGLNSYASIEAAGNFIRHQITRSM